MNNVSFRKPLTNEYTLLKVALSKSRSGFYGLFFFFIGIFVCSGFFLIFKSSEESILMAAALIGVVILVLFFSVGHSYFGLWQRRKLLEEKKISVAEVLCIGVRSYRSHSGKSRKYIYKFVDSKGGSAELKDPHYLNQRPGLNDKCLIVRFNKKYYSIYKKGGIN